MVYAMGIGMSVYMTYVDFPSACLVLVGVALWLYARRRQSLTLLFAAAGAMTVAALMRELIAYMIVIALASVLLEPVAKRKRLALPWLSALAVFAIAYAAHAWNVITRIPDRTGHLNYWQGSPLFALKSFTVFGDRFSGGNVLLAMLFVGGVASAWFSGKRRSLAFAAFALTAVAAPLAGMLFVGNPGLDVHGGSVNYWGMLFVPLALSLWPILLRPEAPPVPQSPILTTSREHRVPKSISAKPRRKKRRRPVG
jgi:hypothetical protein